MIDELTLCPEVPNTQANQKRETLEKKKKKREDLEIENRKSRDRKTITSRDQREKIRK